MKNLTLILFALVVLAACGKDEPAQPQTTAPAVTEETVTDEPAAATETTVAEETETVVVEESAAEPEEGEQAIVLAQAEVPAASYDWQFEEGEHYQRLVPTQPTVGGADKIEVAELWREAIGIVHAVLPPGLVLPLEPAALRNLFRLTLPNE